MIFFLSSQFCWVDSVRLNESGKQIHFNKWKSYDVRFNLFQLSDRLCCCHCYIFIARGGTHSLHICQADTRYQCHGSVLRSGEYFETYVVVCSSFTNYNLISSIYTVISGYWRKLRPKSYAIFEFDLYIHDKIKCFFFVWFLFIFNPKAGYVVSSHP